MIHLEVLICGDTVTWNLQSNKWEGDGHPYLPNIVEHTAAPHRATFSTLKRKTLTNERDMTKHALGLHPVRSSQCVTCCTSLLGDFKLQQYLLGHERNTLLNAVDTTITKDHQRS